MQKQSTKNMSMLNMNNPLDESSKNSSMKVCWRAYDQSGHIRIVARYDQMGFKIWFIGNIFVISCFLPLKPLCTGPRESTFRQLDGCVINCAW